MDHTYQRPLQLPACCSVLSAEEMTYTEGGAIQIALSHHSGAGAGAFASMPR